MQLFKPKYEIDACIAQIRDCLERGWTGAGYKTLEFENAWKAYTGFPHALFLGAETFALHLSLEVLKRHHGWDAQSEVITTPLTFIATNHAILYAGLCPVFADVDNSLCLDPEDVLRKITPKTKAVIFVGIGGNTGQYQRVAEICRTHGLRLILDAAHMAGTRLKGQIPGREADAVCYSFHAVKNLPTCESGMLCFHAAEYAERARRLSWFGISKDTYARMLEPTGYSSRYTVSETGYKYNGNSIAAAIALAQLPYLERDNAYRRQIAEWYDSLLVDIPELQLVRTAPDCESSRHLYIICAPEQDALIQFLLQEGISCGVHYRDNTEYSMYSGQSGMCPNARRLSEQIVSLPMHLHLTYEDVALVAENIRKFYKNRMSGV